MIRELSYRAYKFIKKTIFREPFTEIYEDDNLAEFQELTNKQINHETDSLFTQAENLWAEYYWNLWSSQQWHTLDDDDLIYGQSHLAKHLNATDLLRANLYLLLCEEWMRTWEKLDITHFGFLDDIELIWHWAEQEQMLGVQVKCAFCLASIMNEVDQLPVELINECLKHGIINSTQVLQMVRRTINEEKCANIAIAVASQLPPELLMELVYHVLGFEDVKRRADTLINITNSNSVKVDSQILNQILITANAIEELELKLNVLTILASKLPLAAWDAIHVIQRIIELNLQTGHSRYSKGYSDSVISKKLVELIPFVASEPIIIKQVVNNANYLMPAKNREPVVKALLLYLPTNMVVEMYEETREIWLEQRNLKPSDYQSYSSIVVNNGDEFEWARILITMIPYLPKHQALALTNEIFISLQCAIDVPEWHPRFTQVPTYEKMPAILKAAPESLKADIKRSKLYTILSLLPYLSIIQRENVLASIVKPGHDLNDMHIEDLLTILRMTRVYLQEPDHFNLIRLCQKKIDQLEREDKIVQYLPILIPLLPFEEVDRLFNTISTFKSHHQAIIMAHMAPYMTEEQKLASLDIMKSMKNGKDVNRVLYNLTPILPQSALPKVVTLIRGIEHDSFAKAKAFVHLIQFLPDADRPQTIREAVTCSQGIGYSHYKAIALSKLIPYLPSEYLSPILASVRNIEDVGKQVETLCWLSIHYSSELLTEALQTMLLTETSQEGHVNGRIIQEACSDLIKLVPSESKTLILCTVLNMKDKFYRARALCQMAPYFSGTTLRMICTEALSSTGDPKPHTMLNDVIISLAQYFPGDLLPEVINKVVLAYRESEAFSLASIFAALAPYLTPNLHDAAIQAALQENGIYYRTNSLWALFPQIHESIPITHIHRAIKEARLIRSKIARSEALCKLALFLPEEQRTLVLYEALELFDGEQPLGKSKGLLEIINCISFYLTESMRYKFYNNFFDALSQVQDLRLDKYQITDTFLSGLPLNLLSKAIKTARDLDTGNRLFLLARLLTLVSNSERKILLTEIFSTVSTIYIPSSFSGKPVFQIDSHIVQDIAQYLNKDMISEFMSIIIKKPKLWTNSLQTTFFLAPYFSNEDLLNLLEALCNIDDEDNRQSLLTSFLKIYTSKEERSAVITHQIWKTILRTCAHRSRKEFLQDLSQLLPFSLAFIAEEERRTIAKNIFDGIEDVSRWWL